MPCESYKRALSEAAAGAALGSTMSSALRSHLNSCAGCRAFLAQEQALFAYIDAGLRIVANSEVPPSLIPSVRARLSEQPTRRRWILVPATIAVAACLVAVFVLVRIGNRTIQPTTTSVQSAMNAPSHKAVAVPRNPENTALSITKSAASRHSLQTRSTEPAEPLVLVPASQKEAVDYLLATLQRSRKDREVLIAQAQDREPVPTPISPIAIVPMEIKPLEIASKELR